MNVDLRCIWKEGVESILKNYSSIFYVTIEPDYLIFFWNMSSFHTEKSDGLLSEMLFNTILKLL